jgi:hypothetical protein
VPVNTRGFRQFVGYIDPHSVPFDNLDRRPVHLVVKTPAFSAKTQREFTINFFRDQMKYFDTIDNSVGKRRPIRRDYRSVVSSGFTRWGVLV